MYGLSVEKLSREIFEWTEDLCRCGVGEVDTKFFIKDRIENILKAMKDNGCEKPEEDKSYKRFCNTFSRNL